jgi:hypothetical protein
MIKAIPVLRQSGAGQLLERCLSDFSRVSVMYILFFLWADSIFAFHAWRKSLSTFNETSRWMSLPNLASIVMRWMLSFNAGHGAYDIALLWSIRCHAWSAAGTPAL